MGNDDAEYFTLEMLKPTLYLCFHKSTVYNKYNTLNIFLFYLCLHFKINVHILYEHVCYRTNVHCSGTCVYIHTLYDKRILNVYVSVWVHYSKKIVYLQKTTLVNYMILLQCIVCVFTCITLPGSLVVIHFIQNLLE